LQVLERLELAREIIRHPIERFFLADISRLHEPDSQLLKAWFQANAGKTAKPKAPKHPPIKVKLIPEPARPRTRASTPEQIRAGLSSDPPPAKIEV